MNLVLSQQSKSILMGQEREPKPATRNAKTDTIEDTRSFAGHHYNLLIILNAYWALQRANAI